MRKLSKVFLLLVSLMLLVSFLFGTVEVWVSWEGESLFRKLSQEWESETGEQVKLVYIPELEEKLTITLKGGGDLPDICLIKTDNLPMIVDYAQPVETKELDGLDYAFDEKLVQAFHYQSKNFVIPYYADMQLMYLSKSLFNQLEVNLPNNDWTFDEFIEIMEAFDKMNVQPSGWGINSAYIFTGLQEGLGSPVLDKDGDVNLLTQENISLLNRFKGWYDSGLLLDYVTRPNIIKAFSKGELAMFPQGSFLIQKFQFKGLDFAISPLPSPWKSVIDPKGFICFNKNDHTFSLLNKYLQANEAFSKAFIKFPAIEPQHPDEIPFYIQMKRTVENGMVQPIDDQYVFGYWPAMRTALDLILKEGIDVQESLKKAQEYIDKR